MDTRLFALVYQEAQNYSSWIKSQTKLMQLAEEETERENVRALMKAKDFYTTMLRGAA